jgi:hypothetical protein
MPHSWVMRMSKIRRTSTSRHHSSALVVGLRIKSQIRLCSLQNMALQHSSSRSLATVNGQKYDHVFGQDKHLQTYLLSFVEYSSRNYPGS